LTRILFDLLAHGPKRQNLLNLLIPAIFASYFGSLATAIRWSPEAYDWHRRSISWLLYPHNDPTFHLVASLGVAVTGLLMVPFAGYIRSRLSASVLTNLGAVILGCGALLLILAGLIVSHPYAGQARFPRLHEALARAAALALGTGMAVFWLSGLKMWHWSRARELSSLRRVLIAWSLLLVPAILVAALRLLAYVARGGSGRFVRLIENRTLWHLGFWEWIGSAAVFLFLLSSALFLPERASE
jgi:hypothetical protein